jgi:hypothetical protein
LLQNASLLMLVLPHCDDLQVSLTLQATKNSICWNLPKLHQNCNLHDVNTVLHYSNACHSPRNPHLENAASFWWKLWFNTVPKHTKQEFISKRNKLIAALPSTNSNWSARTQITSIYDLRPNVWEVRALKKYFGHIFWKLFICCRSRWENLNGTNLSYPVSILIELWPFK